MDKKKLKKLQLNRKTLRNLDDKSLQNAAGGIFTNNTIACSGCSAACSECTEPCTICNGC